MAGEDLSEMDGRTEARVLNLEAGGPGTGDFPVQIKEHPWSHMIMCGRGDGGELEQFFY